MDGCLANAQFILWVLFPSSSTKDDENIVKRVCRHDTATETLKLNYMQLPFTWNKLQNKWQHSARTREGKKTRTTSITDIYNNWNMTKKIMPPKKNVWKLVELLLLLLLLLLGSLTDRSIPWLFTLFCCHNLCWLLHFFGSSSFVVVVVVHEWWWILYAVNEHKHSLTIKWI